MITCDKMFNNNLAEVYDLLATFSRCWGEGRKATLHLETEGGKAFYTISHSFALGPPGAPRPGAPAAGAGPYQHHHPQYLPGEPGAEAARRVRRRPPSDRRRSAARRAEFLARREAAATNNHPATSESQVVPATSESQVVLATSESQVAPATTTFYDHSKK